MAAQVVYLTLLDVLGLHRFIMEHTGSAPTTVREEGLLESALMRPQTAAYYEGADLAMQTVLLITGIALAHAFVDGNKRTALLAGDTFLQLNGWWFAGDRLELAKQIEAVFTRTDSLEEATDRFANWLRPQLQPPP